MSSSAEVGALRRVIRSMSLLAGPATRHLRLRRDRRDACDNVREIVDWVRSLDAPSLLYATRIAELLPVQDTATVQRHAGRLRAHDRSEAAAAKALCSVTSRVPAMSYAGRTANSSRRWVPGDALPSVGGAVALERLLEAGVVAQFVDVDGRPAPAAPLYDALRVVHAAGVDELRRVELLLLLPAFVTADAVDVAALLATLDAAAS